MHGVGLVHGSVSCLNGVGHCRLSDCTPGGGGQKAMTLDWGLRAPYHVHMVRALWAGGQPASQPARHSQPCLPDATIQLHSSASCVLYSSWALVL
jgi:hypothetical protein